FDSSETVSGTVEAEDLYFFASAGTESLNGTKRHFVILCENRLDIRISLQQVGGYVEAFGAIKVRGLLRRYLDVWVGGDAFFKALTAVTRSRRTSDTLQDENLTFFTDGLRECIGSLLTSGDVIGGNETCYLAGVRGAVDCDDRDISVV